MHCEHGDGVHASLMTTKSLTSDNAARATSRAVIDLQQKQAAELRMLSDEALRQAPKRMEHAARTWLGMTPEQRKVVEDGTGTSECGCIGHSSNLTVEASVKTTEKVVLEANIVRDLAVNVIQRAMWNCPKKKKKHFFKEQFFIKKLTATASVGDSGGPTPCAFTTGSGWSKVVWQEEEGKRPRGGKKIWKHNHRSDRSLRLCPAGKHLNGEDDLPDVPSLCITLSKAFSPSGGDAKFYLNEHRHFYRWCELNGKNPHRVPPRKSSRQIWVVKVRTALMMNSPFYTEYMHEVRADDKDLNKLIQRSWVGVNDLYVVSAWSAGSFVDTVFTAPLWFIIHSGIMLRGDVFGVMKRVEEWIESLGLLDDLGIAALPAVDSLSSAILADHPEWRVRYDAWYAVEGEEIEEAYIMAIRREHRHHVSAHLRAASAPMLATHLRNLDNDCSGNEEVALYAPIVTDPVEGGFGCFDYLLGKSGASVESSFGTAHAQKMRTMTNAAELRKQAEKSVKDKRTGSGIGTDDDVEEKLRSWAYTSWKQALPKKERMVVIKSLQKSIRTDGEERRRQRRLQADAAVGRKRKAVVDSANRRLRAVAYYLKHLSIEPIQSRAGLSELKASHEEPDEPTSNYAEALRDQIRVRTSVYPMRAICALPAIGKGSDDAELRRLEEGVGEVVVVELPPKSPEPSPEFRATPVAPTAAAVVAQKAHLVATIAAYRQFIALTTQGIFRLPRAGDDNDGDEGTTTRDSSKKKKRKTASQPRTRGPRRITFREQQLVGETFEDDGVDWKVLDVAWSDEVEPPQVVVFYYDKEAAVAEGVLENDLLEALDEAGDHSNAEHIEWSTVSEVRAWLLASGRTT